MFRPWLCALLPLFVVSVALATLFCREPPDCAPCVETDGVLSPAPDEAAAEAPAHANPEPASLPEPPLLATPPAPPECPAAPGGAAAGFRLRVMVREQGTAAPLPGTSVRLRRAEQALGEAVTDAHGATHFTGLAEGELRLEVRSDDHLPAVRIVAVGPGAPAEVELTLDPGHRLEVRVHEEGTAAPLAGAEIRLWLERSGFGRAARTGPDGRAELPGLPPGDWVEGRFAVSLPGYYTRRAPDGSSFVRTGPCAARVCMVAASRLSGRVLDPEGVPMAGALVHVDLAAAAFALLDAPAAAPDGSGQSLAPGAWSRTDADGGFALPAFPPLDRVPLTVRADGWMPETRWFRLAVGEDRCAVVVRLEGGGTIEGRVHDPLGRPAPGATVCVAARDRLLVAATCDAEGSFRLRGLRAGFYALKVRAAGWVDSVPRKISLVEAGRVTGLVLELRRAAPPLVGQVVDGEGRPRSGVEVVARGVRRPGVFLEETYWPPRAETDPEGRFRLEGLRDDWTYRLEVNAPEVSPAVTLGPLQAPFGEVAIEVPAPGAIAVILPRELEGEVTRAAAVPIENPSCPVTCPIDAPSFTITGLLPGRYRVEVHAGSARVAASPEVLVPAGTVVSGVTLARLAEPVLAGRVVDAAGLPVVGVRVATLDRTPGGEPALREVRTDARGRFAFHVLAAAVHDLVAGDPGLGFAVVRDVPAGAADLVLTLGPTGAVCVAVRDAVSDEPVAGAEVALMTRGLGAVSLRTDGGGRAMFRITPGEYALVVIARGYQHTGCRVSAPPAGREVLREFRLLGDGSEGAPAGARDQAAAGGEP